MCGQTNNICSWSEGPLCKLESDPKVLCAAISVLPVVKHSYLPNLKKFNVIQDINVASIWKEINWHKSVFYPQISQNVQTLQN